MYITIEVKTTIVKFFLQRKNLTEKQALWLYSISFFYGNRDGIKSFEQSLHITCLLLGLKYEELSKQIKHKL